MPTSLIPQEIYLLERYSSAHYFGDMRDAWAAMTSTGERALEIFMKNLPPKYRLRPLYDQPDITWGETVLANFRNTLSYLDEAFIRLTHGDKAALAWASNVKSDFAGFSRDYSSAWMDDVSVRSILPNAQQEFWDHLGNATEHAANIVATTHAWWSQGALSWNYDNARGPLNPPTEWPAYRLASTTRVFTGSPAPCTGIYLPEVDDSIPAFMIAGKPAHEAAVGYDPKIMRNVSEAPTWWTLVERISDTGGGTTLTNGPANAAIRLRCEAGHPCPRTGYWFTPAKTDSRRHFQVGDIMPAFQSNYGATIWQWDERQDS